MDINVVWRGIFGTCRRCPVEESIQPLSRAKAGLPKNQRPRERRTTHDAELFLERISEQIRSTRKRDLARESIPVITGTHDLESPASPYVALLGEDILLEETPDPKTDRIRVTFTYDEFMEFMVARSMLRSLPVVDGQSALALFDECQRGIDSFDSFAGFTGIAEYGRSRYARNTVWCPGICQSPPQYGLHSHVPSGRWTRD